MLAASRAASGLLASSSGASASLAQELARSSAVLVRGYHKNVRAAAQGAGRAE